MTTSRFFAISTKVLFIPLMQSVNGAQLLNVTCLLLLPSFVAATFAPAPVIFMVPLTIIYESLLSQRRHFNIVTKTSL